jgi:hypothetical protein
MPSARLRHDAAIWTRGFHSLGREILELNFIIPKYFCVIYKDWELALDIFVAHVSQLYHIVSRTLGRFRRPAPKKIVHDGS